MRNSVKDPCIWYENGINIDKIYTWYIYMMKI